MKHHFWYALIRATGALLIGWVSTVPVDARAHASMLATTSIESSYYPARWNVSESLTPLCDLFACGFDDVGVTECDACYDQQLDRSETDIDCGGPACNRCADGKKCSLGDDCKSLVCNASSHTCSAPSCNDLVRNGTETDVDCGGLSCAPCSDGRSCLVGTDCSSHICNPLTHLCSAPTCNDTVKNGTESDIDCGGLSCPPCSTGRSCLVGTDCSSHVCNPSTHTCSAPTCVDGVKNGTETDVDCGGLVCPHCGSGKTCTVNSDCQSGVCGVAGQCQ